MEITYERAPGLSVAEFIDILERSGLAERRPVDDAERLERMLRNADIIVVARDAAAGRIVGVARAVSDFAYCCYLSDLAVAAGYQGRGIGRRLIEETRAAAGPQSMCLLVAAPKAVSYYERIGMPRVENAFIYRAEP